MSGQADACAARDMPAPHDASRYQCPWWLEIGISDLVLVVETDAGFDQTA